MFTEKLQRITVIKCSILVWSGQSPGQVLSLTCGPGLDASLLVCSMALRYVAPVGF